MTPRLKCTCGGERFGVAETDYEFKRVHLWGGATWTEGVAHVPPQGTLKCQNKDCGKLWLQVTKWEEV